MLRTVISKVPITCSLRYGSADGRQSHKRLEQRGKRNVELESEAKRGASFALGGVTWPFVLFWTPLGF